MAVLVQATGCGSIRVTQDYDPDFNFGQLRTYSILPMTAESGIDDIDGRRLSEALTSELGAKGYEASESPDFLVAAHFGKRERTQVDPYGYGYGWYGAGGGVTAYQYTEGTLVIDFVSAATNTLIWRGTGEGALSDMRSPERKVAKINAAVAEIVGQFPPR